MINEEEILLELSQWWGGGAYGGTRIIILNNGEVIKDSDNYEYSSRADVKESINREIITVFNQNIINSIKNILTFIIENYKDDKDYMICDAGYDINFNINNINKKLVNHFGLYELLKKHIDMLIEKNKNNEEIDCSKLESDFISEYKSTFE